MLFHRTIDTKIDLSIRSSGQEQSHFTRMLTCTTNCGKLAPFLFLNEKQFPNCLNFEKGFTYMFTQKISSMNN